MGLKQEFRDFASAFASAGISDFLPGMFLAPSESGVAVTEMTAMQVAAVNACIRVLSTSLGMLPVGVYEHKDGGEDLAPSHPIHSLLHDAPNDEYSAADFWMTLETHRNITGNGYAEIVRDNGGRPVELWIRSPFRTFPYRQIDNKTGNHGLVYKTTDTFDDRERIILAENMLHIKNFGIDPWVGLSPIRYHMREIFGQAIAAQNYGSRFFSNDARPGGYISSADVMQPQSKLDLASGWVNAHSRGGAHSLAILDGGLKWETVGVNPDEAQFIQSRNMLRSDIAGMYGVPPHFIGDNTSERSANLEQKFLEFLVMTLMPNIRRYQSELNRKLFNNLGRSAGKYFAQFDVTAFKQADFATTLKALQTGRFSGLYTIDEGRRLLGLNPIDPKTLNAENPGGSLWQPVNMVPITDGEEEIPTAPPTDAPVLDDQGNPVANPPVEPGATPQSGSGQGGADNTAPTKAETKALIPVFSAQFRDAIGRICNRKKVDSRDFEKVFIPLLSGIACTQVRLDGAMTLPLSVAGVIKAHVQGIKERSGTWMRTDLDKVAADELVLAIESVVSAAKNSVPEDEDNE